MNTSQPYASQLQSAIQRSDPINGYTIAAIGIGILAFWYFVIRQPMPEYQPPPPPPALSSLVESPQIEAPTQEGQVAKAPEWGDEIGEIMDVRMIPHVNGISFQCFVVAFDEDGNKGWMFYSRAGRLGGKPVCPLPDSPAFQHHFRSG